MVWMITENTGLRIDEVCFCMKREKEGKNGWSEGSKDEKVERKRRGKRRVREFSLVFEDGN